MLLKKLANISTRAYCTIFTLLFCIPGLAAAADGDILNGLKKPLYTTFGAGSVFQWILYIAEGILVIFAFMGGKKHPMTFISFIVVAIFLQFLNSVYITQ